MRKSIIWLLVSCLMTVSLIVISCGQSPVTTTETPTSQPTATKQQQQQTQTTTQPPAEQKVIEEKGLRPPEEPKYGGVVTTTGGDPWGFDPAITQSYGMVPNFIVQDAMLVTDWGKGPAGTGEVSWKIGHTGRSSLLTGNLAESYEMPDNETIIFHLKKGVHWQNKPPVNGREFTAEDMAWSIEREWASPTAWTRMGNSPDAYLISATALDKYTVELKVPAHVQGLHLFITGWGIWAVPHEVIDMYGDMTDWHNLIGTGPYMLDDYVPGSAMTFVRNPNYHLFDPINPENRLPYLDGLEVLNIPDASTAQAAFRTGKTDMYFGVSREDFEAFTKQRPDLKYSEAFPGVPSFPTGRQDKPDLPFHNLKVRQAMNLAVDQQAILKDYYGGYAILPGYPFTKDATYAKQWKPLSEYPQAVQELFTYNPEKAKQLLAEAGYPNGFKTTIVCTIAEADWLSIVREYLLAVGIDMQIDPKETGLAMSLIKRRKFDEMSTAMTYPFVLYKMNNMRADSASNPSFWETPQTREAFNEINANLGKDDAKIMQILEDLAPHVLEEAWGIWLPVPYSYDMWQPWIQNYHGETNFGSSISNYARVYIWMDPELKKSMGY